MTLPRVRLGETGLDVSRLGLGTVKLGRSTGVKYPTPVSIPDAAQARALLDEAAALGINLVDTAPAYGESEARLGELLRGRREQWIICTKVGEEFDGRESRFDFSPEHCRASVIRSLRRLRTDHLDVVLIHSNGDDLEILEHMGTLQALQDLRDQGLITAVGISHKTVGGAELALDQGADVIMATLNRSHTAERDVIARAAAQGCGVLIKKALASGHARPEDLRWVAAHAGVHCIIVGTTDIAHLRSNAAQLQVDPHQV